jgi:hypothetical protein
MNGRSRGVWPIDGPLVDPVAAPDACGAVPGDGDGSAGCAVWKGRYQTRAAVMRKLGERPRPHPANRRRRSWPVFDHIIVSSTIIDASPARRPHFVRSYRSQESCFCASPLHRSAGRHGNLLPPWSDLRGLWIVASAAAEPRSIEGFKNRVGRPVVVRGRHGAGPERRPPYPIGPRASTSRGNLMLNQST